MDWVLNHLQLIIVIAGSIAYWINQRRRQKEGEAADYDGDGVPDTRPAPKLSKPQPADEDETVRTRRIQEEIRKKIQERTGRRDVPPPLVAPRPVAQPLSPSPSRRLKPVPPPLPSAELVRANEDEAKRQRELVEQMRLVEERRAEAKRQATQAADEGMKIERPGKSSEPSATPRVEADLLALLRDVRSARRAFILREVLGPPAGLK